MESVDFFDKYLDPPDEPLHSPCDGCGEIFDTDDLTKINGQWVCYDCVREAELEDDNA